MKNINIHFKNIQHPIFNAYLKLIYTTEVLLKLVFFIRTLKNFCPKGILIQADTTDRDGNILASRIISKKQEFRAFNEIIIYRFRNGFLFELCAMRESKSRSKSPM